MKPRKKGNQKHLTMETVEFLSDLDESDTICRICMAEFVDPEDLKWHISAVHQDIYNSNIFCKWCLIPLSDVEHFAIHVRDYHLENLKSCPYCFRLFNNYAVFKVHKARHLIVGPKKAISCSNCPCLFKDTTEVTKHEYKEHQHAEGIMINHCFPHLSSVLNMWVNRFFKGIYNLHCIPCSYKAAELNEYIKHLKSCREVSLVCDNCCKPLKDRKGIIKHIQLNRCKNKPNKNNLLKCRICHNSFPKELFEEHSENCLKCTHCDEIFNDISKLAKHQATHSKFTATLLYCKYCTANFINKASLDKHTERSHKHELHLYKYKCKTCSEVYKHPKYLFRHYFSRHKELMPYKCRICNNKFKTRKSFTIHIKVVHKSNGIVKFDENFLVYFTRGDQDVCIHDHDYSVKNSEIINGIVSELPAQQTSKEAIHTNAKQDDTTSENVDNSIELSNVNDTTEAIQGNETTNIIQNHNTSDTIENPNSSDDDQPLSLLKKLKATKRKRRKHTIIKNRFTCNICNICCYTFQHYNRHMSLHSSKISKQCVKCNELFKRRKDLEEHVISKHSHSELTDTLKKFLERRKLSEGSVSEKFRRTIKRVYHTESVSKLKITKYRQRPNVTVKNFLENFTRDLDNVEISNATITIRNEYIHKEPVIQLTEVDKTLPKDVEYEGNLQMPIRVPQQNLQSCNVIVKVLENAEPKKSVLNFGYNLKDDYYDDNCAEYTDDYIYDGNYNKNYDDPMDVDDKNSISTDFTPEASHEISLRESTHPPDIKVVIPNLPKNTELKIGCLIPQAPYFNIVPVKKILKESKLREDVSDNISLPNGEKLVSVNPLEHLLAGKSINLKLNKSKQKFNTRDAIKNALIQYKLGNPVNKSKGNKKASTSKNDHDAEEMQCET